MHDYGKLKREHGIRVSQTIDSPIMILDFWELSEAFVALFVVLIFGVVFYSWALMSGLLLLVLIAMPIIRGRNNRGVFFHWPYRRAGLELPGIINPKRRRKFSD